MVYILDLIGVAVFAVAGSLAAGRKRMDLFGVLMVATVTALGGGTLRDLTLGIRPVFWVSDPLYILVAAAAAILTFALARSLDLPKRLMLFADAFGLAIFTVIGAKIALGRSVHPGIAVIMGVMTGVAGGMIRDVLCGQIPLILRREIYATASLCGAGVFVGLAHVLPDTTAVTVVAVAVTLAVRLAAIYWRLSLPVFAPDSETSDSDGPWNPHGSAQ